MSFRTAMVWPALWFSLPLAIVHFGCHKASYSYPSSDSGRHMEIRTWCPPYDQEVWKAALATKTGGTYSPSNVLTSVAGQFWHVQSDGTLTLDGFPETDVQWTANYCHTNGIKFLCCVTNWNDDLNDFDWNGSAAAFSDKQQVLIANLLALVEQWNADGIDIDFESSGDLTHEHPFASFIQALGSQLHAKGKVLTLAIFPNDDCAPAFSWMSDWVGYVDGVESMGYGDLAGGGSGNPDNSYWDSTYKSQQQAALKAGYKCSQFCMGMPGDAGTWGTGGLGTTLSDHLKELQSGKYNSLPTSVCIWDAEFTGSGWLSADTWTRLHSIRETTHE